MNGSARVSTHRAYLHRGVMLGEDLEQRVHAREHSHRDEHRRDAFEPGLGRLGLAPAHHCPTLGIDFHGSAGGNAPPFCNSSTEMLSGERTKAMWPSRGRRLMVTP